MDDETLLGDLDFVESRELAAQLVRQGVTPFALETAYKRGQVRLMRDR